MAFIVWVIPLFYLLWMVHQKRVWAGATIQLEDPHCLQQWGLFCKLHDAASFTLLHV
jgi:hypothetical protein